MSCGGSGAVALDVISRGPEPRGVIAEAAEAVVAIGAKQAAVLAGDVAMVDREALKPTATNQGFRIAANGTEIPLLLNEGQELFLCHAVISPQIAAEDKCCPFFVGKSVSELLIMRPLALLHYLAVGATRMFSKVFYAAISGISIAETKASVGWLSPYVGPHHSMDRSASPLNINIAPQNRRSGTRRMPITGNVPRLNSRCLYGGIPPAERKRLFWIVFKQVLEQFLGWFHPLSPSFCEGGLS